ncbi:MAG: hypothetical protein Q7S32_03100 [bacterium]|nr:hypothetical protein [bacterium]
MRTINQTYQDAYRSKKRRKFAAIVAVYLAIFGAIVVGVFYALFFSQLMAVTDIAIEQKSFISNEQIQKTIDEYLEEKTFFIKRSNNIFLPNKEKLALLLAERFPVLKDIQVKKDHSHKLIVQASHREGVGIWCFKKQNACFYFDQEGVIFDHATESSGTLFLMVEDYVSSSGALGQLVTNTEQFSWMMGLQKEMTKAKVGLAKAIIPEELFRVNVKTTEGWEIYLSTNEPLSPQIKALSIFLANKVSMEQRSLLQYVDARIPNRIYFK